MMEIMQIFGFADEILVYGMELDSWERSVLEAKDFHN